MNAIKYGAWPTCIRDKDRATVCGLCVDNKDYLPSLARLSADDQLTVSQVCDLFGGVSANRRPMIVRYLTEGRWTPNCLPSPKDSRPIHRRNSVLKVGGVVELF